ncbi:DUF58 domain-containing protein [Leptospira ognonensis]|uniref:DUF58 domain-containing protein n=1 Tax=Leptospira ognonensis TaxID=2484945 RepID=A0A4R9K846_9LEPT|nr:DUF58 domain-containing protein [Leptospira ognonensis]TGL61832.1 DUF58 domain-containing protein [Leptospira ognonensis]
MLEPDLKRLLNILKWETKRKFKSLGSGGLTPSNRGRGIEFKEVRLYNYGDDTRYIDWNVTSRTGEVYVKEYYSEQDVPVIIAIDCSRSMSESKQKSAFQLAFFLTLFHIKLGNKVRMSLFSEIAYHSGRILSRENDAYFEFKHLSDKFRSIQKGITNYKKTLEYLSKISPKFTICYWLSDFCYFDGFKELQTQLNKWENYGIWIEEEIAERELPFWFRIFELADSESNSALTRKDRLHVDLNNFNSTFRFNKITIRPEKRLSSQLLALFQRERR